MGNSPLKGLSAVLGIWVLAPYDLARLIVVQRPRKETDFRLSSDPSWSQSWYPKGMRRRVETGHFRGKFAKIDKKKKVTEYDELC